LNKKFFRVVTATVATVGMVSAGLFLASSANASGNSVNVAVTVANVPVNLSASKLEGKLKLVLCRVNDGVTVAPVAPTGSCNDSDLDEVGGSVDNGSYTATYGLRLPSSATSYAMYLVMEKSSDLGFNTNQVSAGVVNTLSSSTIALDNPLPTLTLGSASAPSSGRVAGRKVAVNLTVTGLPVGMKADKVKELLTVCVNTLAADVTSAPTVPGLCLKSGEIKGGTLNSTTGVYSATYQLNAPAIDGVQNYALYLQTKKKDEVKLTAQTGAGQFVVLTTAAGVGSVTTGLDGLTIDLSQNSGVGAIRKVVPIVVPATGTYAVIITKIDGSKETPVAMIPVTIADTQVAIPANLKNGNYRVQVVATSTGDTFVIDTKGYLDGRINAVEGRQSR
jgi:hypothetical protein